MTLSTRPAPAKETHHDRRRRRDVIFTGIGGQGVQLCSKVLANAAVAAGRHVMLSSYFGGEMRGGRTEATVITRDQPVDLPPIPPKLEAMIVLHPAFLGRRRAAG